MPTVMLTATCQNACPWCFARSKMKHYRLRGIEEMSWQDFTAVVEFYERSDFRQMNLLGGEPTMHSRFIDVLTYLKAKRFATQVVTNGIVPASLVDALVKERFPHIQFVLNSTSYFDHTPDTRRTIDYFLHALPHAVSLSYTITLRDVLLNTVCPILDRLFLITKFGLRPHLHLQIAVPADGTSDFVPFDQYQAVVELLQSWIRVLQENRVSCGLDCHCIPYCRLPREARFPFPVKSACSNFQVDIGPNLDVWPCFPLSSETFRLEQFHTVAELKTFFSSRQSRQPLLWEQDSCQTCPERLSKACDGGCRGFQILRKASLADAQVASTRRVCLS